MCSDTEIHDNTSTASFTDRVTVFRCLTIDEIQQTQNQEKFNQILTDGYDSFVAFCNEIVNGADASDILDVSCYIEGGIITFEKTTSVVATIDISPSV